MAHERAENSTYSKGSRARRIGTQQAASVELQRLGIEYHGMAAVVGGGVLCVGAVGMREGGSRVVDIAG